jgi:hypothetical protein
MLMKNIQVEGRPFVSPSTRPHSWLSMYVGQRVFAVLVLLFIAVVTIASTTGGKQVSGGANLMLAPGKPGLAPALY